MPISIKNLFSFRKAANPSNIDTLTVKTWIEKIKAKETKWTKAQPAKKRDSSSKTPKNLTSIFSRITSIFKKTPKVTAPPMEPPAMDSIDGESPAMESMDGESMEGQKTTRELNLSKMKQNLSTTLTELEKQPANDFTTRSERRSILQEARHDKLYKNYNQVSWLMALTTTKAKDTISHQIRTDLPSLESNLEIDDNDQQMFDFNVSKTEDEAVRIGLTQNLYKAGTGVRFAKIKIKIDIPPEENAQPIIRQFEVLSFPQPITSSSSLRNLSHHPLRLHPELRPNNYRK